IGFIFNNFKYLKQEPNQIDATKFIQEKFKRNKTNVVHDFINTLLEEKSQSKKSIELYAILNFIVKNHAGDLKLLKEKLSLAYKLYHDEYIMKLSNMVLQTIVAEQHRLKVERGYFEDDGKNKIEQLAIGATEFHAVFDHMVA